jgi:pantetheine-phosphate adenylyltransferase
VADLQDSKFAHRTIAVGGTFDILHVGHELLLNRAFELGETVFIGVTGDQLVLRLHKSHEVRSFVARNRDLRRFLRLRGWLNRARIIELKDPFGPAASKKRLEALVVSEETLSNGTRINVLRRRGGLPPLRLYVVRLLKAKDGKPISVTRIRLGELDARGILAKEPATRK